MARRKMSKEDKNLARLDGVDVLRRADLESGTDVLVEVDEAVTEAATGPNWALSAEWPARVETYEESIALLTYLWAQPRAYSVQDLTLMSQVRFEASRKRRIHAQYYALLKQLARRWESRDRLREQQGGAAGHLQGVFTAHAHLTMKHEPAPAVAAQDPGLLDWRAALPTE